MAPPYGAKICEDAFDPPVGATHQLGATRQNAYGVLLNAVALPICIQKSSPFPHEYLLLPTAYCLLPGLSQLQFFA